MAVVNVNGISGINSITAQSNALDFYNSAGNTLSIGASLTGNVTGNVTGNATGLSGTPNITVGTIGATSLVVSGITTVAAGSPAAPSISPTGDSNTGIFFPSADTIAFGEGGVEAARIDSSGRLLIGTSSAESIYRISFVNYTPLIQAKGGAFPGGSLALTGTEGGAFWLTNSTTQSAANLELGTISINGYDGTNYLAGARIQAFTDGTCGANDLPTRMVFMTTPDGSAWPIISPPAMTIKNSQEVLIGTNTRTANGGVLQVSNGITFPATQSACSDPNTLDDYEEGTWTPAANSGALTSNATATYTKIGRTVTVFFDITMPTQVDGNSARLDGLPFGFGSSGAGVALGYTTYGAGVTMGTGFLSASSFSFRDISGNLLTLTNVSGKRFAGACTYSV